MSGSVLYSYLYVSQCVVYLPVCQAVCGVVPVCQAVCGIVTCMSVSVWCSTCMSGSVWYSYLYVSQCVV